MVVGGVSAAPRPLPRRPARDRVLDSVVSEVYNIVNGVIRKLQGGARKVAIETQALEIDPAAVTAFLGEIVGDRRVKPVERAFLARSLRGVLSLV